MLFNSLHYFSIIVLLVPVYWFFLKERKAVREIVFIFLGLFFYGEMNLKLSGLLFATATIDFFIFRKLYFKDGVRRKLFLFLSILINFAPLLAYKFMAGFQGIGTLGSVTAINIPIGISFYTFKSVGALIDVYNGRIKKVTSYLEFLFFVTYFPALLCGPVSRLNQFRLNFRAKNFKSDYLIDGIGLILTGLFKKICVADGFFVLIGESFTLSSQSPGFITSWAIISAHLVQVYFDFSGYTDIARGVARLFGHDLVENFKYSLIQSNIAEFWRRHHISMTEWFRDYIYLPLLKSSPYAKYPMTSMFMVSVATFFISGIWHNFGWSGIIFGVSQGLLLALYGMIKMRARFKMPSFLGWLLTYFPVALSTHFILAPSENLLIEPLKGALSLRWDESIPWLLIITQIIILLNMLATDRGLYEMIKERISKNDFVLYTAYGIWATSVATIIGIMANEKVQFIYYQF